MKIILNKGTPDEEVYTEEQLKSMTKAELKTVKIKCQNAMGEIGLKRSRFKNENDFDENSKEFWKKMNKYKAAIAILQRAIFYIGELEKTVEPAKEVVDKQHWLWCYYQESLVMLPKRTVAKLIKLADERNGSHIEFEQFFKEKR